LTNEKVIGPDRVVPVDRISSFQASVRPKGLEISKRPFSKKFTTLLSVNIVNKSPEVTFDRVNSKTEFI
jgi:hypothetical protein